MTPQSRCGAVLAVVILSAFTGGALSGGARARLERELRSTLIYPPTPEGLRMDHSHPEHRKLRCVRCHENAGTSGRASDSLMPSEETCLPCHEDRISRDAPASRERCGYCHVGYGAASTAVVPPSESVPARLHFSHSTHVRRERMRCLECHAGIEQATVGTVAHLPTMRSCFECHDGRRPEVGSDCALCHLSREDGVLRTGWPEGRMNPKRWQQGMHHDADWRVRHRWVGADQGSACASCHRERDCEDCHDGRVRPPTVHPNDFLTGHAVAARRDEPRCTSCHQQATFCGECHARLGLSPVAAARVRTALRFHPPGDVWVRGPVEHAREARRSMSACASCHAETDCVQCHGALGIGAGLSPHPPGFARDCRRWLELNDRACRTCHGSIEALRSRCR